jgi:hypothetical protein
VITQEKMEAAMQFLSESDISYAEAKTHLMQTEILCKRIRSRVFVTETGSVEARKAAADVNKDVIDADDGYIEATLEYETIKARRSRAEIVIDVWRSIEASRRKA